jgi:thioredoxin 1
VAGALTEATKENFRELVAEGLSMVDVWGPSCQPCFALMPHFERLAAAHPEVTALKLEAPKARRLCMELRLLGLPVFLVFKDGEEVARLDGADISPEKLESWLEDSLKRAGEEVSENGAEGQEGGGPG